MTKGRDRLGALTAERRKTHGDWRDTARIADDLCAALDVGLQRRRRQSGPSIAAAQLQALRQIMFKAARIIAGDPNHPDHWLDICGYSELALHSVELCKK